MISVWFLITLRRHDSGNAFRITDPFVWGEATVDWIPLTKVSVISGNRGTSNLRRSDGCVTSSLWTSSVWEDGPQRNHRVTDLPTSLEHILLNGCGVRSVRCVTLYDLCNTNVIVESALFLLMAWRLLALAHQQPSWWRMSVVAYQEHPNVIKVDFTYKFGFVNKKFWIKMLVYCHWPSWLPGDQGVNDSADPSIVACLITGFDSSLQWRHNDHDGVSNYQPHNCLLNRLFRHRSKKTSKLRVTGLCAGNSPETGEFPAQRASNAENASIWWHHHVRTNSRSFYEPIIQSCRFRRCCSLVKKKKILIQSGDTFVHTSAAQLSSHMPKI